MFIPITAGIHKIVYKKFFIYNISGATLWSIFYGILGYYLGTNLRLLGSILTNISYTVITIILIVIIYLLFKRYEKAKYIKI